LCVALVGGDLCWSAHNGFSLGDGGAG
jgi:hypothetical protein